MSSQESEREASSPHLLAPQVVPDIEQAIAELVVDAFQRWSELGFDRYGDYEDHFTVRLVACMNQLRRERNLALVPRFQAVEPSLAMYAGEEDPSHSPRIDITVCWDLLADGAYLCLECKRLAPNHLTSLYVSQGISRFARGQYAPGIGFGGMVGYIVGGSPPQLLRRVNESVRASSGLGKGHELRGSAAVGSLRAVYTSAHLREPQYPDIRLKHLWLDLTSRSPVES